MNTMTQGEFNDLWQAALEADQVWTWQGHEGLRRLPQTLGQGQRRLTVLREGLQLWLDDMVYDRPLHLDYVYQIPQLTLTFYLSGDFRIVNPGLAKEEDRSEVNGESCICYLPQIRSIEYYPAQQSLQRLTLSVDIEFLRSYFSDSTFPLLIRQLLEGKSTDPFHQTFGIAARAIQPIVQQILSCPYQGALRQMFLESKSLELLTLQLARWAKDEQQPTRSTRWKPQDLEKLERAKEILQGSIEYPPSLAKLAQQVGLNDCKLKQGFRQVFGTTVFGYLRACQMERAKQLLRETDLYITEIAAQVGYSSLPAFSNAFYKQVGMSPHKFRQD
ncbi:helix-turn-helix transcriptional regulator [Cyanobacteria bacterium FACHB-63]|nr:helix-turn-helix transcriptional regulator [Cyanobacteria bacterium FACHB-63]